MWQVHFERCNLLTKVKSKAFSRPVPQPDMMRCTNCMDSSILYMRFVFMLTGSSTFKRRGSSDWSVTSTSAKRMPILYATMVNVWRVNIALVIRAANLALHVVSRMLTSLLLQSFQSSVIIVKISRNFLRIIWIINYSTSYRKKNIKHTQSTQFITATKFKNDTSYNKYFMILIS